MKPALEFFPAADVPWAEVADGVSERVLARDEATGMLTRILRWAPGVDTSADGPVTHEHVEEVLILAGSMQDLAPAGFVVSAHEITLRGLCAECSRSRAS